MTQKPPQTTVYRCPSCGAPITMRDDDGVCDYCGTVVRRQHHKPNAEPVVIYRGTLPAGKKPPRQSSPLGCIVPAVIIVSIIIPIIASGAFVGLFAMIPGLNQISLPQIIDTTRVSDVALHVPRDGEFDDLLVYMYQDSDYVLGLIDGGTRELRWKTGILSADGQNGQVAFDSDRVYYADRERLYAVSMADGSPQWEASLVAEIAVGCDACLHAIGGRIVALQKDGSLQAFNTADGSLVWSLRSPNSRAFYVSGDAIIFLRAERDSYDAQLTALDPADGSITWEIQPVCRNEEFSSDMDLSVSDSVYPLANGDLLLIFGSSYPCAQRWSLGASAPTWETALPQDARFGMFENNVLASEDALFVAYDGGLARIDSNDGSTKVLIEDEEQTFVPVTFTNDLLVVKAAPTWDLQKHSLWGIDITTGERRWQFALEADEWLRDAGFGEWDARAGPAGIVVVQVPEDPARLIVERLDPQNGTVIARDERNLGDSSKVVWGYYWSDQMGWLMVDTDLVIISLRDGSVATVRR